MTTPGELGPDGTNDIYNIVIECTALFESLSERAKLSHGEKDIGNEKGEREDGKMGLGDQSSSSKLGIDEMERSFTLWIDYTGALADVSRSLDMRLHAHSDIKEMVTDLLQMLARNLEYLHKSDSVKPDVPSSGSDNNSDADELEDEARYAIQKALDELHFMAAAIRRSSVRSQKYNLSSRFHRDDDSYFQEQACLLVRYYFMDARRSLCDQLGASLAMRRSKFFRRIQHEEKLRTRRNPEESKHSIRPQQLHNLDAEGSQVNLPPKRPTVQFKAPLGTGDTRSQLNSEVARHHLRQGPALSTISMGSSIRLSSAIYPDKPKFTDGRKECACPYCARRLMTSRLKNEPKYWQNHMDEDIEPYVCLSEECTTPMLFFVHMKDWMSHMETFHSAQWNRKIHMSTWHCDIGHTPAIQFNNRDSFVRHLKDPTSHGGREPPTDPQLETLSRNKQRVLIRDDEYCCPICERVPSTLEPVIVNSNPDKIRRHLYEHIAAHIKDLAFKSIPDLDEAEPSERRQSEVDDGDHRRLRGDGSAASYLSGLDELRQETSVTFGDDPDRDNVGMGGEAYNVDYYNMDESLTLWDNPEFVEHWGRKAALDPYLPDFIMAETISGVAELSATALQAGIGLYMAIKSVQSHQRSVIDLQGETGALINVLDSLNRTIASRKDLDLSALEFPLERCEKSCKEFTKEIEKFFSLSGGNRPRFRDWTRLGWMGEDIDGFRQLLAGYKSMISVTLADATLQSSTLTAERIEGYTEMIQRSEANFEDRFQRINDRLEMLVNKPVAASESEAEKAAAEVQQIQQERNQVGGHMSNEALQQVMQSMVQMTLARCENEKAKRAEGEPRAKTTTMREEEDGTSGDDSKFEDLYGEGYMLPCESPTGSTVVDKRVR
ncbi:hypothetical protein GGI43DRAFT_56176 [Trichoderma evansii]